MSGETEDRLDSWKKIASYLKRDVTTVQRWERREAMPIHRHLHDKMGSVFAYRSELDEWWDSRRRRLTQYGGGEGERPTPISKTAEIASQPSAPRTGLSSAVRWSLTVGAVLLAGALAWLATKSEYFWRSPLENAKFIRLADFGGSEHEQAAAISRDGKFVAFLSDRDGPMDG